MNRKCMSERTIDTMTSKNVQMVYTYALCTHAFVAKKRRMKMLEIRAKTLAFQNWAVGPQTRVFGVTVVNYSVIEQRKLL